MQKKERTPGLVKVLRSNKEQKRRQQQNDLYFLNHKLREGKSMMKIGSGTDKNSVQAALCIFHYWFSCSSTHTYDTHIKIIKYRCK